MTLARVLPPLAKEIRALLPIWLGCLGALTALAAARAGAVISDGSAEALGLLVYGVTAITLGAFSIGHEYTCRTLPQLLCQPESRASILIMKMAVLAAMLVTLAGAAWGTVVFPSGPTALFVLAVIPFGLFVTPCLTMLCRNPLAGAVFTIVIPGLIWLLANLLAAGQARFAAFAAGLQTVSAIAVVMCWVMFRGLEASEGQGRELRLPLPDVFRAADRQRHPLWRLVRKELALQHLSIAVAGIASLGWLSIFLLGLASTSPRQFADPLGAVAALYSGLLAMVIGALASAEERQLGTLEWQVLLPMASWKQWAVKVAVTLGLALLLSVLLPALLLAFTGGPIRIGQPYAGVMLLLTTASLYVSSLSSSGVRALIVSLPISLIALSITVTLLMRPGGIHLTPISTGFVGTILGLGLYFALVNHRSAERGTRRILLQVFCLTGCAALSVVLVAIGIR
jgi:hypothetical protein